MNQQIINQFYTDFDMLRDKVLDKFINDAFNLSIKLTHGDYSFFDDCYVRMDINTHDITLTYTNDENDEKFDVKINSNKFTIPEYGILYFRESVIDTQNLKISKDILVSGINPVINNIEYFFKKYYYFIKPHNITSIYKFHLNDIRSILIEQ